ncbi:MAG: hydroxymethylglutaryl-CoA synthase [Anaerolineae bacterium]|nr:hydroxymethylglutaryl-CoA synthase [Anaerolineae bacterium]
MIMRPSREVGIVGYGAYVPRYRLPADEVGRIWGASDGGFPVREKSVSGLDEDTTTMAIEAARNALRRAEIPAQELRAVWVGTESKTYAVKPTGTIVAEALGATPYTQAADWEFACKAGTEALQAAIGLVGSGMVRYALVAGVDAAQGRPGDALEYTAGAGGAAFIVGPREESLAYCEGSTSYVTDTPDFFRRAHQRYPSHGGRFTGEPAYFRHIQNAAEQLLKDLGRTPKDYAACIFHQPNAKFPERVGRALGFSREQMAAGMLVSEIGNCYAGSSLLGLTAALDQARPGDRILLVSFGSGAGSDAFSLVVTEAIEERRHRAPATRDYVRRRQGIDYGTYARFRQKLRMD